MAQTAAVKKLERKPRGRTDAAGAFAEMCEDIERRTMQAMRTKDGTPAKDRLLLALKTGILSPWTDAPRGGVWRDEPAIGAALHCMDMAAFTMRDVVSPPRGPRVVGDLPENPRIEVPDTDAIRETATRRLDREADDIAMSLLAAAQALAAVIGGLADELDAAEAANAHARRRS